MLLKIIFKKCYLAECSNYAVLDESNRAITYRGASYLCDRRLSGWYRFVGKAGGKMSHSCVIGRRCGANGLGWLVGRHPSVSEGCARRRVCFASFSGWYFRSSCCRWSTFISVRNCGTFFVYKLRRPPTCNLRYCGDGIPSRAGGKRLCCLNYLMFKRKQRGLSHVGSMRMIMLVRAHRSSSLLAYFCHLVVWTYQGLLHSWFYNQNLLTSESRSERFWSSRELQVPRLTSHSCHLIL